MNATALRDKQALLAAILADPDDDVPRLIYADWCEEHGDQHERTRAEVIRRQRAEPGWDAWHEEGPHRDWHLAETRDVRALFGSPSCGMIDPRPEGYVGIGLALGFVSELSVTRRQWLDHGEAAVRRWPIRRVVLNDLEPTHGERGERLRASLPGTVFGQHAVGANTLPREWWPFMDAADGYDDWPTPEAALDAAGRAALLWARDD
jgi:uncharacterized protein (TIGR02996 family)